MPKIYLRALRKDQPKLTVAEVQALENMIIRRALERGLKVRLSDGTILEPPVADPTCGDPDESPEDPSR